jgi:hypothetical protein
MTELKIGTVVHAEIINQLSSDRALVRFDGRELVMQFTGVPAEKFSKVNVQITGKHGDVVYARVVESGYSLDEILDSLNLEKNLDRDGLRTALKQLRDMGMGLTADNVRKLYKLNQKLGNPDLAAGHLIKDIDPEFFSLLTLQDAKTRARKALETIEKYLIENAGNAESLLNLRNWLDGLTPERLFRLKSHLLFFSPGFESRLLKESKDLSEHIKFRLLLLKKALPSGDPLHAEIDSLLGVLDLDSARSVATDSYAAFFYTLFWRDGRSRKWVTSEVSVRHYKPGRRIIIDLVTDFERLGTTGIRVIHELDKNTFDVNITAGSDKARDHIRSNLNLRTDRRVRIEILTSSQDGDRASESMIKKIDIMV